MAVHWGKEGETERSEVRTADQRRCEPFFSRGKQCKFGTDIRLQNRPEMRPQITEVLYSHPGR
jgi:hypothetical protein